MSNHHLNFKEVKSAAGPVYMQASIISAKHGFTTRWGGVSTDIYDSLNLGEFRGDKPECVTENYIRMARALQIAPDCFVFSHQVHKNDVKIVTTQDRHTLFSEVPYEADALVTREANLALVVFTADCVPILLHDPVHHVIAAVHAGWRSTVLDIVTRTIRVMQQLGAQADCICAGIGPCIASCCFETGVEVPDAVKKLLGTAAHGYIRPSSKDKFYVDLKGVNRHLLLQAGLRPDCIAVSSECTSCQSDKYWSHRKTAGMRGSQASIICMS